MMREKKTKWLFYRITHSRSDGDDNNGGREREEEEAGKKRNLDL